MRISVCWATRVRGTCERLLSWNCTSCASAVTLPCTSNRWPANNDPSYTHKTETTGTQDDSEHMERATGGSMKRRKICVFHGYKVWIGVGRCLTCATASIRASSYTHKESHTITTQSATMEHTATHL
jgi:hypothetical protein